MASLYKHWESPHTRNSHTQAPPTVKIKRKLVCPIKEKEEEKFHSEFEPGTSGTPGETQLHHNVVSGHHIATHFHQYLLIKGINQNSTNTNLSFFSSKPTH